MGSMKQRLQLLQSQVSAKPVWTTEKPTKQGWYWYREAGGVIMIELVQFERSDAPLLFALMYRSQRGSYQYEQQVEEFFGEWAGPVEVPS